MAGAAKAVAGYENPLGRKAREGSSPSARTINSLCHHFTVLRLILAAGNRVGLCNRQNERSGMLRSPSLAGWPGGKEVTEMTECAHYVLLYFACIGHQK